MPNPIFHIIGGLGVVMATTAAIPKHNTNDNPLAASQNAISTAAPAGSGPGLPADFPIPPGLKPCKPLVASGEIICDWHGVGDGRPIYNFYLKALPKAGYTLLRVKEELPADYKGPLALGFKKGSAQGAVTIAGGDLSIQYLPHE
jgi:hypothetical protein